VVVGSDFASGSVFIARRATTQSIFPLRLDVMANLLVDFVNDHGHQMLNQIAVKHTLPLYVLVENTKKLASDDSQTSCAILAPQPRFPTNGKAACWLSHAYYLQQRDKLAADRREQVERYLHKRAVFWDIVGDVRKLVETEVEVIKQASATNERYPLRNPQEVVEATNWLVSAYQRNKLGSISLLKRVELAGRLLDAGAERIGDKVASDILWRASCRRGCYDGRKVAAAISQAIKHQTGIPAARLADACGRLIGQAMQSQHKVAAVLCDKLAVFSGIAPELALASDTSEPVYIFPSGSTVKLADMDAFASREMKLHLRGTLRIGKVSASTVDDMQDGVMGKMEAEMDNAGVSFVVRKPRELKAMKDFS